MPTWSVWRCPPNHVYLQRRYHHICMAWSIGARKDIKHQRIDLDMVTHITYPMIEIDQSAFESAVDPADKKLRRFGKLKTLYFLCDHFSGQWTSKKVEFFEFGVGQLSSTIAIFKNAQPKRLRQLSLHEGSRNFQVRLTSRRQMF